MVHQSAAFGAAAPVHWPACLAGLESLVTLAGSRLIAAGFAGSLTNTVLVLGMIGLLKLIPWVGLLPIATANGLPEAGVSALLTLAVVAAWKRIRVGSRKKSTL